ncbi:MAG TPA: substrate-binding domain-containing protein, partial [Acidobacteriaceae bacterium]|nr:substrate-binding domain-containing protein [Acidobacteriaceae bacterium]
GISVPSEVSIVGFDDVEMAAIAYPRLTSIHQPLREMGERAAQIVLGQIAQSEPLAANVKMKPTLVCRDSTASARTKPGAKRKR